MMNHHSIFMAVRMTVLAYLLTMFSSQGASAQVDPPADCNLVACLGPYGPRWVTERAWKNVYDQGTGQLVGIEVSNAGQAFPASLTYSFPADQITWGGGEGNATGTNVLRAAMRTRFGSPSVDFSDQGFEWIRQALASRASRSGLMYREVADDNASMMLTPTRALARGDIRFGGFVFTTSDLAYDTFPDTGSDMVIATNRLILNSANNSGYTASSFRLLRNSICHEHGHGLGFFHAARADELKVMEAAVPRRGVDMLGMDDLRATQYSHGDHYAASFNHVVAKAVDFGVLTPSGRARSIVERDLSILVVPPPNGPTGTEHDWYQFTISQPADIEISADPTGTVYYSQWSQGGPDDGYDVRRAEMAAQIDLVLGNNSGVPISPASNSGGPGVTKRISVTGLAAGTYTVHVSGSNIGSASGRGLQLYDLHIRVDNAYAPPRAVAGVDKRIPIGQTCFFMGDINSYATEAGATITRYDWDLDGSWNGLSINDDAAFEVTNTARPGRTYVAADFPPNTTFPHDVNVTLRTTDSNKKRAVHTIIVTVY